MNHGNVNVNLMKVYVIRSKNDIMMSVGVSVKNQIIGVIVKRIYVEVEPSYE